MNKFIYFLVVLSLMNAPIYSALAQSQQTVTAEQIANARQEIHAVSYNLSEAKKEKGMHGHVGLGISLAAVSVISALASVVFFGAGAAANDAKYFKDWGGPWKELIIGSGVLSAASAVGSYKAFHWYDIKVSEIPQALNQLQKVDRQLEAVQMALIGDSQDFGG